MVKKIETGYKDINGDMIHGGDTFKWTLPKGWCSPSLLENYDPLLGMIDYFFGFPYGELTEDTTTISKVVYEDGQWQLHDTESNLVTVLAGEAERYKYGEVVNG